MNTVILLISSVKDGWGPLSKFLGLPDTGDEFPHENKIAATKLWFSTFLHLLACMVANENRTQKPFIANLWLDTNTDYDQKVENEMKVWMNANGYEIKRITNWTVLQSLTWNT